MELLKSVRLISNVLFYRLKWGDPGKVDRHWENYWGSIGKTGRGGQVLWDNEPERASVEDLKRFRPLILDNTLPLLDFGCGNGRQTRYLATQFDRVIGTDVSPSAVAKAREETPAELKIEYRVLNGLKAEDAHAFHDEFGDVNIYMRTVLHVLQDEDKPKFAESLAVLLGERGTLYQIELSLCALDYFRTLPGNRPSGLPSHVHNVTKTRAAAVGFDPVQRPRVYPDSKWEVVDHGANVTINTVPLYHGDEGRVPANYFILRPRQNGNGNGNGSHG